MKPPAGTVAEQKGPRPKKRKQSVSAVAKSEEELMDEDEAEEGL